MRAKDPIERGWVYLARCSAKMGKPVEQTYALFRALDAADRPVRKSVDTLVNTQGRQ